MIALRGQIKVHVIDHKGRTIKELPWQKNLLLDKGLNSIAENPICEIFAYCAKGTGTTATSETPAGSNTYSQTGTTVTRAAGTRDFTSDDEGRLIRTADAKEALITTFTDATHVEVDRTQSFTTQTIVLYFVNQIALTAETDRTNIYGAASGDNSTTTGTGATNNERTFKRTFVFDPETGDTTYTEVGFSESSDNADGVNVRILLSAPVDVLGPAGSDPGQQLKVVYQLKLTVEPNTVTAGTAPITDSGNQMSGNKTGHYIIENYSTSTVTPSGETETSDAALEPYHAGFVGISPVATALSTTLTPVDRSSGASSTELTADAYSPGSFQKTYTGTFLINEAIASNHKSLMLYNPASGVSAWTFLFAANQTKDSNHVLRATFKKTWQRDLS